MSAHLFALEAPQKAEPLAPNQAPKVEVKEATLEVVPIEENADAAEKPVEKMPAVGKLSAYIGIGLDRVPPALVKHLGLDDNSCALVRIVDPNGPAAAAGMQENDIVLTVAGNPVRSHECLSQMMEKHKAGDEVKITFIHRGKEQEKSIILGARAVDQIAADENADPVDPQQMLQGLPAEMRDALRKNLEALREEMAGAGGQAIPLDVQIIPQLQKRAEQLKQDADPQQPAHGAPRVHFQMKSMLKMVDKEGNIEILRDGESVEAKVYDKQGELQWSGPFATPQDKAAVPPPIRERLNELNVDIQKNALRLKKMPNK